jgi:diguanylate cyclase (GGDEF)-like protein
LTIPAAGVPASGGTVLIVDDEPSNIEVLAALLEAEYEVVFATNGAQALELVHHAPPDLILLDVMMPGLDGYEVCARLKSDDETAQIPVIFITGLDDVEAETRGLSLGAADYVTKPFSPAIVRARVHNHMAFKRARDVITELAVTDGLTGLANRRRFDETLHREYRRHSRSRATLSLILLDIDYFKTFNDTYGHVAGDDCLRKIAGALAQTRRVSDLAARYGGEEFACILPETDERGASTVAQAILCGIRVLAIPHAASPVASHVTASLGVVSTLCPSTMTGGEVVQAADVCLYRAKAEGRDRIVTAELDRSPA